MLQLIDPTQPIEWIHPADRLAPKGDKESADSFARRKAEWNPTVFGFLPMTEGDNRKFRAAILEGVEFKDELARVRHIMVETFLQRCLWIRNVQIPGLALELTAGEGGAAPTTVVTSREHKTRFLDTLPIEMWPAIYEALNNVSKLTEGQRGNSGAPSA